MRLQDWTDKSIDGEATRIHQQQQEFKTHQQKQRSSNSFWIEEFVKRRGSSGRFRRKGKRTESWLSNGVKQGLKAWNKESEQNWIQVLSTWTTNGNATAPGQNHVTTTIKSESDRFRHKGNRTELDSSVEYVKHKTHPEGETKDDSKKEADTRIKKKNETNWNCGKRLWNWNCEQIWEVKIFRIHFSINVYEFALLD